MRWLQQAGGKLQRAGRRSGVQGKEAAAGRRRGDRLGQNLLLADHRVGLGHANVVGGQAVVRLRCHDDHVLPTLLDQDQRDAALSLVPDDAADVDALAHKRPQHEIVPPDAADEPHTRAQPYRRDRSD